MNGMKAGQRSAQQLIIIKQMIHNKNCPIEMLEGATIRDENGLALSSRNDYLSNDNKKIASNVYAGLIIIKKSLEQGINNSSDLKQKFKNYLKKFPDLKIDYISIACTTSLDEIETVDKKSLISTAVFFKDIRLIDNFTYFPST